MFTGRIRHLGFWILMWFVAQGTGFITRCVVARSSLLLSERHKTTNLVYEGALRETQTKSQIFSVVLRRSPNSHRRVTGEAGKAV